MSVLVRVRHFFNREGCEAFPLLFDEHKRCAASFPGFIELRHSPLAEGWEKNELEVILEFENESLLKDWRSSPQHAQIAAAYRRFWRQEPEVVFLSRR